MIKSKRCSVLGISAFFHDSAAAILIDGKIRAAAQEERFTRIKHDNSFPINAIKFVLEELNLKLIDLDYIVFYEKPFLKFERLLETYVNFAPKGFKSFINSMPVWLKEKLFQKKLIFNNLKNLDKNFKDQSKIFFSEHHLSHAASAFFSSPFEEAVILTVDGVGEWTTSTIAIGRKNKIEIKKEIHFPHSIGLLYSAFTYFLGFKVNSGEYKVMGLAPYGKPKFKDIIFEHLIQLKEDGSFRLNMDYFDYATGLRMTNNKFSKLFKISRREPDEKLEQIHMDLASSIQLVTEEILLKIVKFLGKEYQIENLCLAGGVALNCVANGKILKKNYFKNIWIQPAAGDAGGALGAAQSLYFNELEYERLISKEDEMQGSYLGPSFDNNQIKKILIDCKANFKKYSTSEMLKEISSELSMGKSVGWFQGKMEFGPRSLGNRSIIANPSIVDMQKKLNLKIKFRESFRPFAPSVLKEKASEWFDLICESPYMLFVSEISDDKKLKVSKEDDNLFGIEKLNIQRSIVPAVTHVDYTARVQTVDKNTNELFYNLIEEFEKITKIPVLVNTSFNVRGEPIVCNPKDAFDCFMGTDLDILVCNDFIVKKEDQSKDLFNDYKNRYELD